MTIFAGCAMPLYAFSLFLPSIINELGYTATHANLLTVPIYVLACIVTCIVGFLGDRRGQRGYLNIMFFSLGAAGYIILIASRSAPLSYFATFLAACGIYPVIPNSIAWFSNNTEGAYKRGVTLAMVIGFGNLNGAVSSNVYRASDRPWYSLGHGMVLMYIGLGMISSIICLFFLDRENKKRDRGERDETIGDVIVTGNEKNGRFATLADAKTEKGDRWSGYRYTL
ncbi:major facilitator superfamily domain-containing protein [Armillaria novae-zelandiae]|uniref:Major facilitator superfamily domain-containing protein n=1 Tax=Armillaria novae-zelandiae TaxID=153914 RepID=A0AA39UIN5_9AGAR|nr:major facilitator superfamily domain-containing protein [Armillaria novae-zelandiae]